MYLPSPVNLFLNMQTSEKCFLLLYFSAAPNQTLNHSQSQVSSRTVFDVSTPWFTEGRMETPFNLQMSWYPLWPSVAPCQQRKLTVWDDLFIFFLHVQTWIDWKYGNVQQSFQKTKLGTGKQMKLLLSHFFTEKMFTWIWGCTDRKFVIDVEADISDQRQLAWFGPCVFNYSSHIFAKLYTEV